MAAILVPLLTILYYGIFLLLLASAALTWIPRSEYTPFGQFVTRIVRPMLAPFRKIIKPVSMGRSSAIDLSPLLFMFLLWVVYNLLLVAIPKFLH
jgi:uncharacterized protein YggT (Ycf19 family)